MTTQLSEGVEDQAHTKGGGCQTGGCRDSREDEVDAERDGTGRKGMRNSQVDAGGKHDGSKKYKCVLSVSHAGQAWLVGVGGLGAAPGAAHI